MTLNEFISNPPTGVNGTYVDVDKQYGPQCWDLVELYAEKVLGIPKNPWAVTLNPNSVAKDAWLSFDKNPQLQKYFIQIPKGQQQRGDVNVYDGHGVYTEGHINIELGGSVFEQNADPDNSPAHSGPRPTTYLLGSLRAKGATMDKITKEQESALALMQTGSYPGANYNYQFTNLPLTQANLDKMIGFWSAQPRPAVAGITEQELEVVYYMAFPNQPINKEWCQQWAGKPTSDAVNALRDDASRQTYVTKLVNESAAYESQPQKYTKVTEQLYRGA